MALSPRERILLEHLASGVREEDPEFAERLSTFQSPPVRPAALVVLIQALSVLVGFALMVLAAAISEPALVLLGMGVAMVTPVVIASRAGRGRSVRGRSVRD
jgi:hypothetical protein